MTGRRNYLKQIAGVGSSLGLVTVSGCTQDSKGEQKDNSQEVGQVSLPRPQLIATSIPDITVDTVVSTGNKYKGLISNTGGAGRALVNMYWKDNLNSPQGTVAKQNLTFVEQQGVQMDSDESTSVTFTKSMPDTHADVWMIASAGSVTTTINNTGHAGTLTVAVSTHGTEETNKTVQIARNEQKTVMLDKQIVTQESQVSVEVSVPDQ